MEARVEVDFSGFLSCFVQHLQSLPTLPLATDWSFSSAYLSLSLFALARGSLHHTQVRPALSIRKRLERERERERERPRREGALLLSGARQFAACQVFFRFCSREARGNFPL